MPSFIFNTQYKNSLFSSNCTVHLVCQTTVNIQNDKTFQIILIIVYLLSLVSVCQSLCYCSLFHLFDCIHKPVNQNLICQCILTYYTTVIVIAYVNGLYSHKVSVFPNMLRNTITSLNFSLILNCLRIYIPQLAFTLHFDTEILYSRRSCTTISVASKDNIQCVRCLGEMCGSPFATNRRPLRNIMPIFHYRCTYIQIVVIQ